MGSVSYTLECLQTLEGHADRVWNLAWSPDGTALASCSSDRTIRIWQRNKQQCKGWRCAVMLEDTHTKSIRCCSWSPGGDHLATASFDGTTAMWAVQQGTWEEVGKLEGHENEVKAVAWSLCGNFIATCGRDKTVWFWERGLGEEYDCMDVKHGHSQDVKFVAWHPTRELLASCSYDNSIRLWVCDEGDWVCATVLEGSAVGHSSTVWCLAFSRDGRQMASVSDDCTVRVWTLSWASSADTQPSCTLTATLSGYHSRTIYSVDWSLEGLIATGDGSNAIKIFGQQSELLEATAPGCSTSSSLEQPPLTTEPDGEAATEASTSVTAQTGTEDSQLTPQPPQQQQQRHEGATAQQQQQQEGLPELPDTPWELLCSVAQAHAADVNCVRWHPLQPDLLASAGDDGVVKLWRLHKPTGSSCTAAATEGAAGTGAAT